MGLTITLPLTDEQAQSVTVAADAFGVEPWEMAVHLLNPTIQRRPNPSDRASGSREQDQ